MDNKFYEDLDVEFSYILKLLSRYCQSEVLDKFFEDLFESFIYSNLINNFFSNLNDENKVKYNLTDEKITEINKEFENLKKTVKNNLSLNLEKRINQNCYNQFISKIRKKYPDFIKLIEELEKLVDISYLDKYLAIKINEIKKAGNSECNAQEIVLTKAIEEFVTKNKDFPDLNDPRLLQILSDEEFLAGIAKKTIDEFSKMKLQDWDIWHSNSSYYFQAIENPELIAKELIDRDICPLIFASNTEFFYKKDNQVKKSSLEINHLDIDGFSYKASESPIGYSRELLKQATEMWYYEWKLFSENYRESYPYLRCYFNACYLKRGHRTIVLYPQIKLYANGVYSLIFREIAPKELTYYLESFIHNEVNLPKLTLDSLEIPPEILKFSSRAKYGLEKPKLPFSIKLKKMFFKDKFIVNVDNLIEKNTNTINEGDFSFNVFPFKTKSDLYLDNLCRIIISAFTYILNDTSKGIRKKDKYHLGGFWTLRPSIYILDFLNQPSTSSEIIEKFGDQLGRIMARISSLQHTKFKSFLGKNLRENFDDYTLHINEALTLWTTSKKGLVLSKNDPNRGDMIYEKQVQVESIDHLYLSHRRLFEKASLFLIDYESIISENLELLNLETLVTDTGKISNFGEIDEIINYSNQELGWGSIRNSTKKKFNLRSEYSTQKQNKFYRNFSVILTIIFGLGGITIFTEKVLYPIFSYYKFPFYVSQEIQIPILTIIILFTIVILVILWVKFRNK